MEHYKKIIRVRIFLLAALALTIAGFEIYDAFFMPAEFKERTATAFLCGFLLSLGIIACTRIIRYIMILRSTQKLKLQYNKEHDERMKTIRAKAGLPILQFTSLLMIVAGMIVWYASAPAAYALIIAAVCQMLFALAVKIIYSKKM